MKQARRPGAAGFAILDVHGGGYVVGPAEANRGFVGQIVGRTNIPAFVLEYPLAPEASVPSASLYMAGRRSILAGALTRLRNLFSRR